MFCVRVTAFFLDVLQQVYVAIPVGRLIDFLKGDNVWRVSFDEPRNLLEIFFDAVRTVKSLVDRQAPSMRDIETHDTEFLCGFAGCWHTFEC